MRRPQRAANHRRAVNGPELGILSIDRQTGLIRSTLPRTQFSMIVGRFAVTCPPVLELELDGERYNAVQWSVSFLSATPLDFPLRLGSKRLSTLRRSSPIAHGTQMFGALGTDPL